MSLYEPPIDSIAGSPHLNYTVGVGLAAAAEGLRVTEIVPNGAAYRSGRICVDDVFVSIDGHHVCALLATAVLCIRAHCGDL